jgi:hypothetical protein
MKLTTTLAKLNKFPPCGEGAPGLLPVTEGEIGILTILDRMGSEFTLWALCVTDQNAEPVAAQLAAAFTVASLEALEAYQPPADSMLNAARAYMEDEMSLVELHGELFKVNAYNAAIYSIMSPICNADPNPYRNAIQAANAYGGVLASVAQYRPRAVEAAKVGLMREILR